MRSVTKPLRFPLSGLAKNGTYRETTYPTEETAYSTPMALNVIGECTLSGRLRGGSRPGLKRINGITSTNRGKWLWPNGEVILWNSTDKMLFADLDLVVLPDSSRILLQHSPKTIYRNRYIKSDGSIWFASRTDDFGNFDLGGDAVDVTKAVAGNLADAGSAGEPITALCAFGDQRLFIATRRRLSMIEGEPTSALSTLSTNVGIISANAWCNVNGVLHFIGTNGMYAVTDGAPMLVSAQIPEDLKGLTSALLIYDPNYRGVHIFTNRVDYFYALDEKAFWPVSYPSSMRPIAGGYGIVGNVNRIIFACPDCQYRYWDDEQTTDDGTAIQSKIAIGPFKCGISDSIDGMLDSLNVTMAEGSANVGIAISSAKTAEASVSGAIEVSSATNTFSAGFNPIVRTRKRGAWTTIVIMSNGRWAYESIQANIKNLGRLRA